MAEYRVELLGFRLGTLGVGFGSVSHRITVGGGESFAIFGSALPPWTVNGAALARTQRRTRTNRNGNMAALSGN